MFFAAPLAVILLGLSVGSFMNAVVFRLQSGESILWGRSHCVKCDHVLSWAELIPVASFLVLGGKCVSCHKPISFQYPVVEAITALVFLLVYRTYENGGALSLYLPGLAFYLVAVSLLIGIAVYDYRTYIIAPVLMLPLFLLATLRVVVSWLASRDAAELLWAVGFAAAVGLVFWAIWRLSGGRALGLGDAQLASAIVLFLGFERGVVSLLLSFWVGALVAAVLLMTGRAKLKSAVPFGPFLVIGAFISLFWGEALWRIYF